MLFNSFYSIINFLNNKHICFDTTAVLSGGFEGFIQRCSAHFDSRNKRIYLPFAVIKEVSTKPFLLSSCKTAINPPALFKSCI